ncbi:Hpt domain-containing protein [Maricaulis salignorans]|uniref:Hpt domain-containing protein n=1 Tax=Maricaulis salignorans TaxID=144026 RepID=A0A1G9LQN6_9PROT|nr:Hpt domain-containing protein [Maricaulis salignorans]SDL64114.1 Hpt domain-containing protein [Maricaulis salignorans]
MMTDQAMGWRDYAEIDETAVGALVAAVGADTFATLKAQFVADFQSLAATHIQARRDGDEAAARAAAHGLRGAALNVGLTRLGHLAGALERGEHGEEGELPAVLASAVACLMASGQA